MAEETQRQITRIKLRRGSDAEIPLLGEGEPAFSLDSKDFYVGTGTENVKLTKKEDFEEHLADGENPHNVTKDQVGLGNVDNIQQATKAEFTAHVNEFDYQVTRFNTHTNNAIAHTTAVEKDTWNAKETPEGAQAKADKALADAKAYTDTEIASVIDGSPEMLDTLKELAQALGNDPNFASTVLEELGLKANIVDLEAHINNLDAHITEEATEDSKGYMSSLDKRRSNGYVHNQVTPSATWRVTHNLNKYPSVTVVDSGGTVVIGDILYESPNEVAVNFSSPFSGKLYIN